MTTAETWKAAALAGPFHVESEGITGSLGGGTDGRDGKLPRS